MCIFVSLAILGWFAYALATAPTLGVQKLQDIEICADETCPLYTFKFDKCPPPPGFDANATNYYKLGDCPDNKDCKYGCLVDTVPKCHRIASCNIDTSEGAI